MLTVKLGFFTNKSPVLTTPELKDMKPIDITLLMEFINKSTAEPLQSGDVMLTWEIVKDPILMVSAKDSPLCFAFGWDPAEDHSVFSLN